MEKKEGVKNETWKCRKCSANRNAQPGRGGMQGNVVLEKKATEGNENKDMNS